MGFIVSLSLLSELPLPLDVLSRMRPGWTWRSVSWRVTVPECVLHSHQLSVSGEFFISVTVFFSSQVSVWFFYTISISLLVIIC